MDRYLYNFCLQGWDPSKSRTALGKGLQRPLQGGIEDSGVLTTCILRCCYDEDFANFHNHDNTICSYAIRTLL